VCHRLHRVRPASLRDEDVRPLPWDFPPKGSGKLPVPALVWDRVLFIAPRIAHVALAFGRCSVHYAAVASATVTTAPDMTARHIVVIGGGPAGVFAAIEAKRRDASVEVTLISDELSEPYERPPLRPCCSARRAPPTPR
jgi:Pyridine nucleotide-disulphide oxidoreductase